METVFFIFKGGIKIANNLKSKRISDIKTEKTMQTNFNVAYSLLGMSYKRCLDKEMQLAGIDVISENNNKTYYIDEKCASDFWSKDLKTFAFELSSEICDKITRKSLGKRVDGWLINKNNKTDMYALGYVRADTKENLENNKISYFEVLFIKKKHLLKYINNHIGNTDKLKELDNKIREDALKGKIKKRGEKERYKLKLTNDIFLCWSPCLAESPINLVICKDLLIKLASRKITFTIK